MVATTTESSGNSPTSAAATMASSSFPFSSDSHNNESHSNEDASHSHIRIKDPTPGQLLGQQTPNDVRQSTNEDDDSIPTTIKDGSQTDRPSQRRDRRGSNDAEFIQTVLTTSHSIEEKVLHQRPTTKLISGSHRRRRGSNHSTASSGHTSLTVHQQLQQPSTTVDSTIQFTNSERVTDLMTNSRMFGRSLTSTFTESLASLPQFLSMTSMTQTTTPSKPLFATTLAQHLENDYEEVWIRATSTRRPKRQLVYMIPGNPGVVKAYVDFMSILCRQLDCDGCVVGHLGHCSFSREIFGMESQISHHRRVLKKHSKEYRKTLVLAHSIGSHMTLEITDFLTEMGDRLAGIVLLTPAISKFRPRVFWPLRAAAFQPMSMTISWMGRLMPSLIGMAAPPEMKDEILRGQFASNIFSLLRDTLGTLTDEVPRARLAQWGLEKRKIFIIYATEDPFVSQEVQRSVRYCTEPLNTSKPSVLSLPTIHHSFILSLEQCTKIATLIEQWTTNKRLDMVGSDQHPSSSLPLPTSYFNNFSRSISALLFAGCPRRGNPLPLLSSTLRPLPQLASPHEERQPVVAEISTSVTAADSIDATSTDALT